MSDAAARALSKLEAPGHFESATTGDECAVKVKTESRDCLICANRTAEQWFDVFWTETRGGHAPLVAYICRVAQVRLAGGTDTTGGVACHTCVELINVLERAELEFQRLRDSFAAALADNPAFESITDLREVMVEIVKQEDASDGGRKRRDSDDEPLAARKKRGRKPGRRRREAAGAEVGPVEAAAEAAEVKQEEDGRTRRQSHRYPSPVFGDEPHLSADDGDWNVDGGPATDDNDYRPATKRVRTKRKSSVENGKKRLKTKTKNLSIPVLGRVPSHLVVKEFAEGKTWEGVTGDSMKEKVRRVGSKSKPKVVYPCKECTSKFTSLARLTFHMAKHDATKAPFICEVCGAHYKHKKACDIHVAMHKGISDWKCEECNKLFPSKGALHRHNAIHTGKPNYQCDLCGKSFIHTSSFKMHKLSHTGLKPHSCDICGLALMTRSHLKRHKRIHSGEKRHECADCGKKFSERYNLLAHQKSHESGAAVPAGQPPQRRPWQGFRCHMCDKRFERRYMLEKHMEVVHQRIMERGPPKPRNTMTKLLKAQAAAGAGKPSASAADQGGAVLKAPEGRDGDANAPEDPAKAGDEEPAAEVAKDSPPHPAAAPHGPTANDAFEQHVNGAWAVGTYVAAEYAIRGADYPH